MTEKEKEYVAHIEELKQCLDEKSCDLIQCETMCRDYERQLLEKENKIAFLEGQIKAFQFCIARGNTKNDR